MHTIRVCDLLPPKIVETLLRELVGRMPPVSTARTLPGAIGNLSSPPLALGRLVPSLWTASRRRETGEMP